MDQIQNEQYNSQPEEVYDNQDPQKNETLLAQNELYQEFLKRLDEIKEKIGETSQVVLNLLIYFNFEEQSIYQKLLLDNDSEEIKIKLQEQGIYNESKVIYHNNIICSICEENDPQGLSLDCNHIFCENCWNNMIEIQFSNQIPFIRCLQDKCCERLPSQFLEGYSKYKQILMKRFMLHDNSITWCPGLNCENVFKCLTFSHSVKCPCGIKFCSLCGEEKHYPIPCDIQKKVLGYLESNEYWTALNASKCPQCESLIQRTEGCLHMKCLCGQDFCYKCSRPWENDHYNNFYICPYEDTDLDPSKNTLELQDELQKVDENIQKVECYIKDLKMKITNVCLDPLIEYSQKTINLLKTSKLFLYYKFHLLENNVFSIYEQSLEEFQNEINTIIQIIKRKIYDDEENEFLSENFQFKFINLDETEKKALQNLKIKRNFIKNYIVEILKT